MKAEERQEGRDVCDDDLGRRAGQECDNSDDVRELGTLCGVTTVWGGAR